jgi:hypothetical protein
VRGGCGGLRRWLWDLHQYFHDGGLHLGDITRRLVLTGGELLDHFPQRYEVLHRLLHLRRVEGGSGGRFRRDSLRSSVFETG